LAGGGTFGPAAVSLLAGRRIGALPHAVIALAGRSATALGTLRFTSIPALAFSPLSTLGATGVRASLLCSAPLAHPRLSTLGSAFPRAASLTTLHARTTLHAGGALHAAFGALCKREI